MQEKVDLDDFKKAFDGLFSDFVKVQFETRQEALQAGAEVLAAELAARSPVDTGEFAKSWTVEDKYKDVRYVGNTKTAKGKVNEKDSSGKIKRSREGVPLSNVLEYKEGGKPFIRATADAAGPKVFEAIKKTMNGG